MTYPTSSVDRGPWPRHYQKIIAGVVAGVAALAGTATTLWIVLRKKDILKTLIDPKVKVSLRIIDREFISHDTIRIKLALTSPEHILGLPVGNHVSFIARVDGELVVRPYTPISSDSQPGYVDLVIKVYKANVHPNFPKGGKMSQYLMNIPTGQYIDVRGPAGNLNYTGKGGFNIKPDVRTPPQPYKAKRVNMVCGGSGITPMFQLIKSILTDKDDETKVSLLYANNTQDDILLRDELEQLQTKYPTKLRLWYTLVTAPDAWNYSTGFIDEQMLTQHIYPPGSDSLVLLCGPPPMLEFACYPNLAKLNYPRDRIFTF